MTKKIQLKNGLKILLMESHKSPVVSVQMWVKTGSADESPAIAGISHFIEHLVFKGTQKYKVGEIANKVEAHGGELNAYTSFDQTVFYVNISNKFADVGLDVISQMMGHPLFDASEIDNEREVVIEEIKRDLDSPQRQASQLLFSTNFSKHPYGRPVIGYEKIIRNVSKKKIIEYFNQRYVPQNMFLVVSGDFESADMKKKIDNYFSDFKNLKVKSVKRPKEPLQRRARVKVANSAFKDTIGYLSWKIPNVKHKDTAGLDILAFILGQGDSSRLVENLRIKRALVRHIGCSAFTPQDNGVFTVSFSLEGEKLPEALAEIQETIKNFMNEGPSNEEMQKALTCFASDQIYSLETVEGVARKAGSFEFYTGNPEYFKVYLKRAYQLKPKDIQALAVKYLNPKTLSISLLTDKPKKATEKTLKNFVNHFSKKEKKTPKKSESRFQPVKLTIKTGVGDKDSPIIKYTTPQGLRLIFKSQKELPTVSLSLAYLGGLRAESDKVGGLAELTSRVWATETKKFSERKLYSRIDSLAAGLSPFSGRNSMGINMEFLSEFQDPMLEIFQEVLCAPAWNKEIIEREKEILKSQIKLKSDNPSQLCMSQFLKMMFPNHPYSKDMMGSIENVSDLTSAQVKDFYEILAGPSNTTISVVGDIDPKEWKDRLEQITKNLPAKNKFSNQMSVSEISKNLMAFQALQREQTHIVVGYRGLSLDDPDRFTLQIIQSVLSGQGGRLFIELRDKNSLAYSVSPIRLEGVGTGYFGGYIGCSPEKTQKSIEMLTTEFNKMTQEKLNTAELERAKKYLIGRHDIDAQRKSAIANGMLFEELYGMNAEDFFKVDEEYQKVTTEDVLRVSQKIFSRPQVISVVGPESSRQA